MIIEKATKQEKQESLKLASELKEWFTPEGVKNISIDFEMNSVIVAKEKKEVVGFLCYTSFSGKMLLLWMGVKKGNQRKGIGKALLAHLEKICKELGLTSIEVETLPDENSYEPYVLTRNFYYKNGFKRILYKKARIEGWDDQILLEKEL